MGVRGKGAPGKPGHSWALDRGVGGRAHADPQSAVGTAPRSRPQPAYLCEGLVTLQEPHLGLQLPDVGGRGICKDTSGEHVNCGRLSLQ